MKSSGNSFQLNNCEKVECSYKSVAWLPPLLSSCFLQPLGGRVTSTATYLVGDLPKMTHAFISLGRKNVRATQLLQMCINPWLKIVPQQTHCFLLNPFCVLNIFMSHLQRFFISRRNHVVGFGLLIVDNNKNVEKKHQPNPLNLEEGLSSTCFYVSSSRCDLSCSVLPSGTGPDS